MVEEVQEEKLQTKEKITFSIDKDKNFTEWYNKICEVAELADLRYGVKGFVVFQSWSTVTMKIMYRMYEETLEKKGHLPVMFPAAIPERNFMLEKEHVEGFTPEVFWITEHGAGEPLEEKLALRPTSETAFYQLYSLWIKSYQQLPFKRYQSCQVWRYEGKATKPFIRSREFYWIETHNAFSTLEEAEKQVIEDMETTNEIMTEQFGIPFIFFQRPQWDKFAGAINTYGSDFLMPNGKMLQLPSTHLLGQNFAKPFKIMFQDKDLKMKYVYQTCYGPAISRIYAALITAHGDNKGLILPFKLAPIQVIIISIPVKGKIEKVNEKCKDLLSLLQKEGIRASIDDSDKSPGDKYYYWEMKGVPVRLEIGPREVESGKLTLYRRDIDEKMEIKEEELLNKLKELEEKILENLKTRAKEKHAAVFKDAKTYEDLKTIIENNEVARAPFCSTDMEGEPCAAKIKEELTADVRGTRIDFDEKPEGTCIVCGEKATKIVYIARSY